MPSPLNKELTGHIPHLRKIIYGITKNSLIVDDVTQECCVRIIENEKIWSGRQDSLKKWMNGIARYTTFEYVRKLSKNRKETDSIQHVAASEKLDEHHHISTKQIEWACQQFQLLSERQLQILNMHYIDGMTFSQIGSELGITRQSASQIANYSVAKLRKKASHEKILGLLLPWKWNFKSFFQTFFANAVTEVLGIVFVLSLVLWGGYSLLNQHYGIVENTMMTENPQVINEISTDINFLKTAPTIIEDESLVIHYKSNKITGKVVTDMSGHGHEGSIYKLPPNSMTGAKPVMRKDSFIKSNGMNGVAMKRFTCASFVKIMITNNSKEANFYTIFSRSTSLAKSNSLYISNKGKLALHMGSGSVRRRKIHKISDNIWHHVAFSYDHGMVVVYLNGDEVFRNREREIVQDCEFYFGINQGKLKVNEFGGEMNDIRVYNRVLSQDEILLLSRNKK